MANKHIVHVHVHVCIHVLPGSMLKRGALMQPLCFSYDPLACLSPSSIVFNDLARLVVYSDALTSIFHLHFAGR